MRKYSKKKFFKFDIVIKKYEDSITNEVQFLSILNNINTHIEIRVGTILIIYYTDII